MATQQLATQSKKGPADPLEALVAAVEAPNLKVQIIRALPKQLNIDRFMRLSITVLRDRPDLVKCNTLSIIGSIMEAAQLGLELDPILGHGYLVPFWNRDENAKRCIFIPGYKGFIHLMRNSGLVHNVNAEVVLKGERIEIELGAQRYLKHTPILELDRANRELWLGAYSTVSFHQGEPDFEFMNQSAILAIKARSPSKDKNGNIVGPWKTDELEMWKKTPIRRVGKRMPLSPMTLPIVRAAERDELRELVPGYIESQPMAPALEDLPPVHDAITVTPETKEAIKETKKAADETKVARAETTQPAAEQEKPKQAEAKTESKKTEPAKPAAKADGGANRANKKAPAPPAAKVPEFLSAGQQKSITNYVIRERGFTEADLINMLGVHGFERLEEVPKDRFQTIWSACVGMGTKKGAK